jgi:hypothetical protein
LLKSFLPLCASADVGAEILVQDSPPNLEKIGQIPADFHKAFGT